MFIWKVMECFTYSIHLIVMLLLKKFMLKVLLKSKISKIPNYSCIFKLYNGEMGKEIQYFTHTKIPFE